NVAAQYAQRPSRYHVPEAYRGVPPGGSEDSPAGGESEHVDLLLVPLQPAQFLAGPHIPEADGAGLIGGVRRRGQKLAVRRKRNRLDAPVLARQRAQALPRGRLPEDHRTRRVPGREEPPVGGAGEGRDETPAAGA